MADSADRVAGAAVDLAWSLWRELGVPGVVRQHEGWLVVPEPLILFTGALRDRDRRLRDQAVAWCVHYLPLVSTTALRHTYTRERWPVSVIADTAATMAREARANWVGREEGSPFPVSARFEPWGDPFAEPGGLTLRIRSAFGVGARAEVLRALLLEYPAEPTMAELADAAFATKRHTADAVQHLEWSGLVAVDRRRQPFRLRLRKRDDLAALVQPLPSGTADWGPLLRFVAGCVEALTDIAELPEELAAPELHRRLRHLGDQVSRLRLEPPVVSGSGYRAVTSEWLVDIIDRLAAGRGKNPLVRTVDGSRGFHG